MATREDLFNLFEEFGFALDKDIIDKCFDLTVSYNVDVPDFVTMAVAYSLNQLDGAEPTLSSLEDFERKELVNYKPKPKNDPVHDYDDDYGENDEDGDDLMESYICTTPSTKKKHPKNIHTPSTTSHNLSFSNTIDSPISVTDKDVKGKVVVTFGNSALFKAIDWKNSDKQKIIIERFVDITNLNANNNDFSIMTTDQDYMFDTISSKCAIAADRIFDIGQEICTKLKDDRPDDHRDILNNISHVGLPNQTTVKCIGRICSDNDFKLDTNSTLLIGADEMKLRTARLNFNRLKSYSLFPGQTVFVQGFNPRGDTFFVDEIVAERNLTYSEMPNLTDDLSIVMACGPFTITDDINYEPMNELLAYCKQNKPDVLILIGPFVDADNRSIQDFTMKVSFGTFFENLVTNICEAVGQDVEVLIVSSSQDVHSSAVYPTHPYTSKIQSKNPTFLPDPCIIKVNGVTIALTATDIYTHILDAEVAMNAGDKIKRITNYLFHQRSFYPLNPPSDKVSVDSTLTQQYASLPIVPNILILPSNAKCFARNIDGCLVINPGKLVEGSSTGTFGRIKITANSDKKLLSNYIGCQIIKI